MLDIHSHLLPGIDDGAVTIDQSLELARHAVADGITRMVITPHIHPGIYDNDVVTITRAFEVFQDALLKQDITLQIAMAAEVRLCPEILPLCAQERIPMYCNSAGQRTILLELPHSHVPPGTEQLLGWLLAQGVSVLIAHPERNKELMHHCERVEPFIDMGCKLQMTAGSVSGRFGEPPRLAAVTLLERGWVDVLATDGHNLRARPPELTAGLHAAAVVIGMQQARRLVTTGPEDVAGGMFSHA